MIYGNLTFKKKTATHLHTHRYTIVQLLIRNNKIKWPEGLTHSDHGGTVITTLNAAKRVYKLYYFCL